MLCDQGLLLSQMKMATPFDIAIGVFNKK